MCLSAFVGKRNQWRTAVASPTRPAFQAGGDVQPSGLENPVKAPTAKPNLSLRKIPQATAASPQTADPIASFQLALTPFLGVAIQMALAIGPAAWFLQSHAAGRQSRVDSPYNVSGSNPGLHLGDSSLFPICRHPVETIISSPVRRACCLTSHARRGWSERPSPLA
jgi:hypothetical protein